MTVWTDPAYAWVLEAKQITLACGKLWPPRTGQATGQG
jgi:hypothetical protein